MANPEWWRLLLAVLLPPFAVIDLGFGWLFLVLLLTICGWIPGVIAALIIIFTVPKKSAAVVDVGPITIDDKEGPITTGTTPTQGGPVVVDREDQYKPAVSQYHNVVTSDVRQPTTINSNITNQTPIITKPGSNQPIIATNANELLSL